jgi:transposase, IS30 family
MGSKYSHLSDAERWAIETKLKDQVNLAAIGRSLGRHRCTISRERKRGRALPFSQYLAEFGRRYYAIGRAQAGHRRRKLDPHMHRPAWRTVLFGLAQDWSPQQLCDRLKDGALPSFAVPPGLRSLSHQTIYRAIFGMPPSQQRAQLVRLLRRSKGGRRRTRRPKSERFTGISNITPITLRPLAADLRLEPGHWEGDLIKGARGQSAVGTLVDRFTRMTLLVKLRSSNADEVLRAFCARLRRLPAHMRKTLTYDRGTEMARHAQLAARLDMRVFFCNPYSPWQRGTNENTNGLLRQYLPKGTDLSLASRKRLSFIEQRLNNRPRRVLGRKTPNESYEDALLRFAPPQARAESRPAQPPAGLGLDAVRACDTLASGVKVAHSAT